MKARGLGIVAEKLKDKVFPSRKDQYKGYATVKTSDDAVDKLYSEGYLNHTEIYEYREVEWLVNLYLVIESDTGKSALGYFDGQKIVHIAEQKYPYGIKPKNVKQKFLLHALMDESTPLVIIKGNAGTGKTYCSLAAGLQKVQEEHVYEQILITKSTKKVDHEELGYLPGDLNEKFDPYIDSIYDNLEMLYTPAKGKYDDKETFGYGRYMKKRNSIRGDLFESGIIEIQTLGHIRGRSISKRFFIIDETQNIDPESIKSIVSRAGEGSKFVFLGDPTQIDVPELSETYNGIVYLSEMMKGQALCRQIALGGEKDTVRSSLAQLAVEILV
jgi:PhoH-like ATPase